MPFFLEAWESSRPFGNVWRGDGGHLRRGRKGLLHDLNLDADLIG